MCHDPGHKDELTRAVHGATGMGSSSTQSADGWMHPRLGRRPLPVDHAAGERRQPCGPLRVIRRVRLGLARYSDLFHTNTSFVLSDLNRCWTKEEFSKESRWDPSFLPSASKEPLQTVSPVTRCQGTTRYRGLLPRWRFHLRHPQSQTSRPRRTLACPASPQRSASSSWPSPSPPLPSPPPSQAGPSATSASPSLRPHSASQSELQKKLDRPRTSCRN